MSEKKSGFGLIELLIAVVIMGIIAAIAMPSFVKLEAQSDQDETKSELKAAFNTAKENLSENEKYDKTFQEVGFKPESENSHRYTYNEEETSDDQTGLIAPPAEIKNIEKMAARTGNLERVSREDRRDVVQPKSKSCK